MPRVRVDAILGASPELVWEVVGPFDGLAAWHPAVEAVALSKDGQTRTLTLTTGADVVERLIGHDDGARQYRYTMDDAGGLPFVAFLATVTVILAAAGSLFVWEADFNLPADVAETEAVAVAEQLFSAGADALKERFGSPT